MSSRGLPPAAAQHGVLDALGDGVGAEARRTPAATSTSSR